MRKGLKSRLEAIPTRPGVYVFRDSESNVIYVGKAKSLRDRLRSYFQPAPAGDGKGEALREDIHDLEVTVCASEVDALILEASLIKKYRPRYNVYLRDDKSYPYIAVTLSEEYPRALYVRGDKRRGNRYYGPYVNARAAKTTLRLLSKVFPLRHCTGPEPGSREGCPCMYMQMKMCTGPCTGAVDREEYASVVRSFCAFLEGRHVPVIEELDRRMREAARLQEYETAARLRNQIEAANRVLAHPSATSKSSRDHDVIGIFSDGLQASFAVAQNRSGAHLGTICLFSDLEQEYSGPELVSEFVKRFYDGAPSIPREVVTAEEPVERDALEEWLSGLKASKVTIGVPVRGAKLRELGLAEANAKLALEGLRVGRLRDRERSERSLRELAEYLSLETFPLRIECYDISTMAGSFSVGSMVVFQDGLPDRRAYRRFKIKFVPGVDDVGMMKEVLYRRFKRYLRSEGSTDSGGGFEKKPDLVVLDGGKGQLGAAREVFSLLGIEDIEVAALAKRLEEVYRPGRSRPLELSRDSEALFLLMRARDEAHRVAVEYHRSLMEKATAGSWLDEISGVGPGRKKALIRHFGSPGKVMRAELEDLKSVKGVPDGVAVAVYEAAQGLKGRQKA